MSKFRPMDSQCPKCKAPKALQAGCWHRGVKVPRRFEGVTRMITISKGYWKMRCKECNYVTKA